MQRSATAASTWRSRLADTLFIGLVVWSMVATTAVLRGNRRSPVPRPIADRVIGSIQGWRSYSARGHATGNASAPITLVVFSDFECPYCRKLAPILDTLRSERNLRIVERNFPIPALHPAALEAALAGECASDIGQYWAMRSAMFGRPGLVEDRDWGRLAALAGIGDTESVVQCVRMGRDSAKVSADLADVRRLAIAGTPGILINDSLFQGTMTLVEIKAHLAARRVHEAGVEPLR
jgi:protein-disulfide isomerase